MKTYIHLLFISLFTSNLLIAQDLNILLHKSGDKTVYLTQIQKHENHTYTEDGRADISFNYKTKVLTESTDRFFMSIGSSYVRLIPDTNGLYKIETTTGGRTHYYKDKQNASDDIVAMWLPGIRETSPKSNTYFIGYSNDTTLTPVRILKILEGLIPVKNIYENTLLDEEPALTYDGKKLDLQEYIKRELIKNSGEHIIKEVSGFVTFKFVVDENGSISDVDIDKLEIKNKELVPPICAGINSAITKYYYLNDQRHRWIAGKLNGIPVASLQYITIYFK